MNAIYSQLRCTLFIIKNTPPYSIFCIIIRRMRFYEVLVADNKYHTSAPLTYSSEEILPRMSIVSVSLRNRVVTGFVLSEVDKPSFGTKPIKAVLSQSVLPSHVYELATWLKNYYASSLGEALRQFAPSKPTIRNKSTEPSPSPSESSTQLELEAPLTSGQENAIKEIKKNPSTTVLLHGATGSGKTRVYLELARGTLDEGRSVILLIPEISLTTQLTQIAQKALKRPVFVMHSQMTQSRRKDIWKSILESTEPIIIIGPRSALFSPVQNLGLIILDESHEPAYKQDQSPRYHASRVASQIGLLTGSKVILGSATPSVTDYFVADKHSAIVRMKERAIGGTDTIKTQIIDIKDRSNFSASQFLSAQLLSAIKDNLNSKKQVMVYLNRRGSARLILCNKCGWQLLCPNCDVPLVYHGDSHSVLCHICGHSDVPPTSCAVCQNPEIIYKSIGTKALIDEVKRLFPGTRIHRFDSDNTTGERLHELYDKLHKGEIDILVGTQLLAKGLDLPRLGLVGIISAETSLSLPDFSSEERAFQLLYQVIGRVGRGHGKGEVILQSYEPQSGVIRAAVSRDWDEFYEYTLTERQKFRFPPYSILMQLTCKRATLAGAEQASKKLKEKLIAEKLPVEIVGPSPSFYAKRGKFYFWQIVVKSKHHAYLIELCKSVPQDWSINIDPMNLL
jgi:primosomal protein N' (replication factor Y)